MSIVTDYPRYIKAIEYASMTSLLQDFCRKLEHESGGLINDLDVNASEIISDLCQFLGLSEQNRRKVLGANGARHMELMERALVAASVRY